MTAPVRDTLRVLRSAPDRWAHPGRRRAARLALRALGAVDSVVVLCHGNICRSPLAAACIDARLERSGASIRVESGGFVGPGRGAPAAALAAAERLGIDLSSHRSRMICSVQFRARPLVLVMHPGQRSDLLATHPQLVGRVFVLGDFDPEPIETREIADPWGGSAAAFDASYARIRRCVASLPLDTLR